VEHDISRQNRNGQESLDRLLGGLEDCRIRNSPYYRHLDLDALLNNAGGHRTVKCNDRKQVIFIQTALGDFYIKISLLTRPKDRLRHLLLPRRRWAEWNNLHKLKSLDVEAAEPVMRGQNFDLEPRRFFIVTRAVEGHTLTPASEIDPGLTGGYIAGLHHKGFYYADWHPGNIVVAPDGRPVLIDAQELFFLGILPGWLRSHNLGRLYLALNPMTGEDWFGTFLAAYNRRFRNKVAIEHLRNASIRHYRKHLRSRTKRCLKNSSEFEILRSREEKIYRRKGFRWDRADILGALENGVDLKEKKVIAYKSVCIKIHAKGRFHRDRCLASWINSRALDLRGIDVPTAQGYYRFDHRSFFIADYIKGGIPLYQFLPTLVGQSNKRKVIRQLARWVRNIHENHIWQKDFNATNVMYYNNKFLLLDLDNVKLSGLSEPRKILNLAQLNASTSGKLKLRDRLRFLYYYYGGCWPPRAQRRAIYARIWGITLTKNTVIFGLDNTDAGSFRIPR